MTLDRKSQKFISLLVEKRAHEKDFKCRKKKKQKSWEEKIFFFSMWTHCGGSNKLLNEIIRLHKAAASHRIALRAKDIFKWQQKGFFLFLKNNALDIEQPDFFLFCEASAVNEATLCFVTSIALSSFGSGQCSRGSLAFFVCLWWRHYCDKDTTRFRPSQSKLRCRRFHGFNPEANFSWHNFADDWVNLCGGRMRCRWDRCQKHLPNDNLSENGNRSYLAWRQIPFWLLCLNFHKLVT